MHSVSDTITMMELRNFWKIFYLLALIALLDIILVHCIPIGEVHSPNNNSQGSWSGLSDILEINHFDPGWQDEIQSGNKEGQQTQISPTHSQTNLEVKEKPKRKRIRDKAKLKIYRQNYKNKINSNPLAQQQFRKKKNESNKRWEEKKVSKLSEVEKQAFFIRKQQIKKEYDKSYKEKYGRHSCTKLQRISEIRKLKKQEKATEDELKELQHFNERQKLMRKKRSALKGNNGKN